MTTAAPGLLTAAGPAGPVEYLITGEGSPATVFVHGLTGSIAQTRPFGSGVAGSRAFVHLRGHGCTPVPVDDAGAPTAGDYRGLAAEVAAVADVTGATRGLGVSLGAGALVRMLVDRPETLERAVLMLPSALDGSPDDRPLDDRPLDDRPLDDPPLDDPPAHRLRAMADAVEAGDVEAVARLLREHQPAAVRRLPAVTLWARRRASELVGTPVAAVLRGFAGRAPLRDPGELTAVRCPVLVIAQDGDQVHPVQVARRYAAALPDAVLEVLPAGAVPWTGRDRLREIIAGFLAG